MKHLISQGILASAVLLMLALLLLTDGLAQQEAIMAGAALAIILISVLAERLFPFQRDWNIAQGDTAGDITLFILVFGLLDGALKWLTPFALLMLAGDWAGGGLALPLWAQAVLVTLIIELGAYASHYAHHNSRFLWPLHAMHHSPRRLYTLNNFRFHPLNHVINHVLMIVPVLLIGFSAQAVLIYTALATPVLLLQHSNIDFRFGWMSRILNTNEAHRWHHSDELREGKTNYGRATLIWDHLFGTFHRPGQRAEPRAIGLFASSRGYPGAAALWEQLSYPFSPRCCTA